MKVLMLWKYYPPYLTYFYDKNPAVIKLPFEEHREKILDDHFGWPCDLSRYMNQQGIPTEFIIANAENLQKKWAEENKFISYSEKGWEKEIAMEQIKYLQPDVLWIPSIFDYFGDFVKSALPYCKKAITWVGSPFIEKIDVSGFSVLLTESPNTFRSIQKQFEQVIVTKPFFNSEILEKIGHIEKKYDMTFVGGITPNHSKRAELLAYLIKNGIDLKVFGYYEQPRSGWQSALLQAAGHILKRRDVRSGLDVLKHSFVQTDYQRNVEIIKSVHQGPIFGLDMYRTLAESRITLNVHIDVAGTHAGNIRMFEATGVGTCLLTEHSENINEIFKPGEEVLTYKSKEDLLQIVREMLTQNEKVEQIAKAGQKKTLQSHTMERMFNDIQPAFNI